MPMTMVIKFKYGTAPGSELWEFEDGLELPNLYTWNLNLAYLDFRQKTFALEWKTI